MEDREIQINELSYEDLINLIWELDENVLRELIINSDLNVNIHK